MNTLDEKLQTLTARQRQIYDAIRAATVEGRPAPTFRELAAAFDIRSPNGIATHLKALEKKGLIERGDRKSRGIKLVDNPLANLIAVARQVASDLAFTEAGARLAQAVRQVEAVAS